MSLEGLENTWLWLDNPVNTHEGYNRMEKSHVPGSGQPREVIPFTCRCSQGSDPIHMLVLPNLYWVCTRQSQHKVRMHSISLTC